MRSLITLSIIFFALLSACKPEPIDRSGFQLGFSLTNKADQKKVIDEMKEQSIDHYVNEDGYVRYSVNDYVKVNGIKREVATEGNYDPNYFESASLNSDDEKGLYIEKFDQAGVRYHFSDHLGIDHIHWSQIDGENADLAIQCILQIQYGLATEC